MNHKPSRIPPVAVCVLSHGNQTDTARAVRSARSFGLPVYVGLTGGGLELADSEGIRIHSIPWQDDFAAARNRLLQYVDAMFVLWLDSDEELLSFPEIDWRGLSGDVFRILLHSYVDNTPIASPRLHRNKPGLSWHGRIHEIPYSGGGPHTTDWKMLHSVAVRHYGYQDPQQIVGKHERNLRVSQAGPKEGTPGLGELRSLASWQAATGRFDTLSWVRYYKKVSEATSYDVHVTKVLPAKMLCSAGYTRPARELLKESPLLIPVHLAVLAAQMQFGDGLDAKLLSFVVQCLQNGHYHPYADFPAKLLGGSREDCLEYVEQIRAEWRGRPKATMSRGEDSMSTRTFEGRYRRIESFDSETFEDDLLVMHTDTRDTMVLNPTAAVLWEALKWPQSIEDLAGLLAEAFPSEDVSSLRTHVERVMGGLLCRNLVTRA